MKTYQYMLLSTIAAISLNAPAVKADTYSSVTTTNSDALEPSVTRETRTMTTDSAPMTVVREAPPVVITQPEKTVIVKKHPHHLLNLGVVKVF
jgi:hypothetical protein